MSKQEQAQIPLGQQLRSEMAIALRRQEDAAQLANALNMSAQLADQCDELLRERKDLKAKIEELEAFIEQTFPKVPGAPHGADENKGGSGVPEGPAEPPAA